MPDFAEEVAAIIRDVAEREILPRFRSLSSSDIEEKNPGDLVTVADRAAEAALTQRLAALLPDALIVGEEAHETDPDALSNLKQAETAWVIDPLDGTRNFAKGIDRFAVIIALCRRGEAEAGWIFDPINNRMARTARGSGAVIDAEAISASAPKPVSEMTGSVGNRMADRVRAAGRIGGPPIPRRMTRYGCVGLEYMDLAAGKLDFARYAGKLMPWDHAAGVLMFQEAGGYAAVGPGERAYRAGWREPGDKLLLAPGEADWSRIMELLDQS